MAGRPDSRDNDPVPYRSSDMKVSLPGGFGFEANGSTVTTMILIVALILTVVSHHYLQERHNERALAVFSCIFTLNEEQRREFRNDGKYCSYYEINGEMRRAIRSEK
jgi:hypothetical protein